MCGFLLSVDQGKCFAWLLTLHTLLFNSQLFKNIIFKLAPPWALIFRKGVCSPVSYDLILNRHGKSFKIASERLNGMWCKYVTPGENTFCMIFRLKWVRFVLCSTRDGDSSPQAHSTWSTIFKASFYRNVYGFIVVLTYLGATTLIKNSDCNLGTLRLRPHLKEGSPKQR